MKKIIMMLLFTVIASGSLWASPSTHAKAAEDLLLVTGTKVTLEKAIEQQLKMQVQSTPDLAPYEQVMMRFLEKNMGWETLKNELIRLYTQTFTEAELHSIVDFYKSPVGQKMVTKQSELVVQGTEIVVKKVQDNLPELEASIKAESARLKKK